MILQGCIGSVQHEQRSDGFPIGALLSDNGEGFSEPQH